MTLTSMRVLLENVLGDNLLTLNEIAHFVNWFLDFLRLDLSLWTETNFEASRTSGPRLPLPRGPFSGLSLGLPGCQGGPCYFESGGNFWVFFGADLLVSASVDLEPCEFSPSSDLQLLLGLLRDR